MYIHLHVIQIKSKMISHSQNNIKKTEEKKMNSSKIYSLALSGSLKISLFR